MTWFEFNFYSALLLPGWLQGMVFAGLFWRRWLKHERLADQLMAALLLVLCMRVTHYMLGFAGWYDSHDWRSTFMFYFPFHLRMWIGPLAYFYFRALTNQDFRWQRSHLAHFVPGAIELAFYLFVATVDLGIWRLIQDRPLVLHWGTRGFVEPWSQATWRPIFSYLGVVSILYYLTRTLVEMRAYRKYISGFFSDLDPIEFNWLRRLLYLLLAGFGVMIVFAVLDQVMNLSYQLYWWSHLATAITIYALSILAYTHTQRLPHELAFDPHAGADTTATEPAATVSPEWCATIHQHFARQRPYLDPELSLATLARQLHTNSTLLSAAINQCYQQNFNDFVNGYRVRAVQQRLMDPEAPRYTLLAIALECGFNSKATFNRAFRKHTQLSPSAWLTAQGRPAADA